MIAKRKKPSKAHPKMSRRSKVVFHTRRQFGVIPNRVVFVKLSQIGVKIRGCKTEGCDGNLVPVAVKSTGMSGGLSVCFGCKVSFTRYENEPVMISV